MRFEIGHTHAYPGCRVQLTGVSGGTRGGDCLIEFSDGVVVLGRFIRSSDSIVLHVPAHQTAKGTRMVGKTWRLAASPANGVWRVRERLPDDPTGPAPDPD